MGAVVAADVWDATEAWVEQRVWEVQFGVWQA
jgi:hypothetical protein